MLRTISGLCHCCIHKKRGGADSRSTNQGIPVGAWSGYPQLRNSWEFEDVPLFSVYCIVTLYEVPSNLPPSATGFHYRGSLYIG